jgi:hypothetical protein
MFARPFEDVGVIAAKLLANASICTAAKTSVLLDAGAHGASPVSGKALGDQRAAAVCFDENELCACPSAGDNAVVDNAMPGHNGRKKGISKTAALALVVPKKSCVCREGERQGGGGGRVTQRRANDTGNRLVQMNCEGMYSLNQ